MYTKYKIYCRYIKCVTVADEIRSRDEASMAQVGSDKWSILIFNFFFIKSVKRDLHENPLYAQTSCTAMLCRIRRSKASHCEGLYVNGILTPYKDYLRFDIIKRDNIIRSKLSRNYQLTR